MATYEVLIVTNNTTPVAIESGIEDGINAFSDGNTWNVTYRHQTGSRDPSGYDVVVFPQSGIFNSNWAGAGDWSEQSVPMLIPGNRFNNGSYPMSASGSRSGSYDDGLVTAAGEAHDIGVELGWAEDDTISMYGGGNQAISSVGDIYANVDQLVKAPGIARMCMLAVEEGAVVDGNTFPSRRIWLNAPHDMDSDADDTELLRVSLLWVMDELGGVTFHTGSGSASISASASGSGVRERTEAGSASSSITTSATGQRTALGSGSAAVALSTSATGQRTVAGSGSASASITTSGSGVRTGTASGSTSISTSSSATGQRGALGSATAALAASSSATGVRTGLRAGSGAMSMTGAAAGKREAKGTGTAGLVMTAQTGVTLGGSAEIEMTAQASGVRGTFSGPGSASASMTSNGTGQRTAKGSGSSSLALGATGAGTRQTAGSGAASMAITSAASGFRVHYGRGSASCSFGAQGTGQREARGTATATATMSASATAQRDTFGTANGAAALSATATGKRTRYGTGSGSATFAAAAEGTVFISGNKGQATLRMQVSAAGSRGAQGSVLGVREPSGTASSRTAPDLSPAEPAATLAPIGRKSAVAVREGA